MFELSKSELDSLRCQFGISKRGGTRYAPFAFTEQGVAMFTPLNVYPVKCGAYFSGTKPI
jgi:hypothetical protein